VTGIDQIRAHLRAEYTGVFTDRQIEQHVQDYVVTTKAAELVDVLQQRLPATRRVLDIGCGFGSFVLLARERGIDAVGIEPASVEVAFARARLAEHRPADNGEAVYRIADARSLAWPDRSFDAVTMWNVLEHIPDARRAIAEAARVLTPGGTLLGIAPNYAAFRREAHYGVPWLPLMPRQVGAAYLRRLGRDPRFWLASVEPVTQMGIARAVRAAGLELRDRRAEKLADPESVNNAAVRGAARVVRRAGFTGTAQRAVRAVGLNPFASTIFVEAVKPHS
jgi:MPBQ/MSBQ methyltransferase